MILLVIHTMYINYFRQNPEKINNYIWIIENDVYFLDSFKNFIDKHSAYQDDLLVGEYGLRDIKWRWTNTLRGFKQNQNIGVLCVIMRFSAKLMNDFINNIDNKYSGYLECVLPHICIEYNYSIQQFLPEMCGILSTNNELPLLHFIRKDIVEGRKIFLENKIYHPIKL